MMSGIVVALTIQTYCLLVFEFTHLMRVSARTELSAWLNLFIGFGEEFCSKTPVPRQMWWGWSASLCISLNHSWGRLHLKPQSPSHQSENPTGHVRAVGVQTLTGSRGRGVESVGVMLSGFWSDRVYKWWGDKWMSRILTNHCCKVTWCWFGLR